MPPPAVTKLLLGYKGQVRANNYSVHIASSRDFIMLPQFITNVAADFRYHVLGLETDLVAINSFYDKIKASQIKDWHSFYHETEGFSYWIPEPFIDPKSIASITQNGSIKKLIELIGTPFWRAQWLDGRRFTKKFQPA